MKSRYQYCTQTAVAALLIGLTGAAQAQTSDTIETVTVTGFRASLQNALDAKQKSNLIMESVTAEDVGKMPDQNIAESLQRLPGVQIDRSQGHGTQVLINGLRQNLTTLNGDIILTGKEFYVSGESSGNGAGANAQYNSLEGIPSEELGRVDVYKSPNASLTEGGLGGIVDLRTRDALQSPDGFSVTANLKGSSTSFASLANTTPNATVVASYKPNSTFAITGSVSYDAEDTHTKEFEDYNRASWVVNNSGEKGYTGSGPLTSAYSATTSAAYMTPSYGYFSDIYDKQKTIGATLGANWNVSDAITTSINWFYSHISERTVTYSDKVAFNGKQTSGLPGINADKPYSIDSNGVVDSATFWMTGAETATLYQRAVSDANNLQWHTAFDDGGPITATVDVSLARASSSLQADQQDIEHGYYLRRNGTSSLAPTAPGCDNMGTSCTTGNPAFQMAYANGGDDGLPSASYQAPYADVLSNPNYALFKSAWAWANATKQTQDAIRGAVVYKPSFLKTVEGSITGGFRYSQRDVWQSFGKYLIDRQSTPVTGSTTNDDCCYDANGTPQLFYMDPGYDTQIPYDTAVSNPSLAKTVHNFAVGDILVKDPVAGGMTDPSTFLETIWNKSKNVPAGSTQDNTSEKLYKDTLSSFGVHEFKQAYYLMADLGGPSNNFHANFGVRVVLTDLTAHVGQAAGTSTYYGSASWNGVNSNNVLVVHHKHTVDVLPSINLSLNVTDDQIVRFGAARVMSPQDLFSLGLGNTYNFTRTTINGKDGFKFLNGKSGNPDLDPYRATQFNLAWEYYFAPGALASVSTFYKQVDNFVETQTLTETVMDDFGGTQGTVTKPVNAGHGSVYGLELASQYAFDNGFGFAANYTNTQSTSDQVTSFTDHLPIPGVAKHSATGTVYYEKYGFDARMSYSWRSKAVNQGLGDSTFSVPNSISGATKTYGIFTAPYGELDGQVTYNVNDNLSFVVSAQNLTDEAYHTYLQYPNQPYTYDDSGTRYFFGVRFHY